MKVELLAPAANLEYGRAAILAGADAVYIGGPGFGARRAAGVSVNDIEQLVIFAHGFGARVYVAMNTILMEDELNAARAQAIKMYEIGVDALIVQDMAYTMMELPPIELHASTQTFNLTPERVKLLENAGFSRVILERGATMEQIRAVRAVTSVELEAFVHGAICVSYSGQCYLGHALCGRGGNRGGCAQACRSKYNLENSTGKRLISDVPILSPKDLNLSEDLGDLLEAGICSFKIEGRLKELDYVINVTAYYNALLDEMMVERTSDGVSAANFKPDLERSFSRGFTSYMLHGPQRGVGTGAATRSQGFRVGTVVSVTDKYAVVTGAVGVLDNGDGVCFVDPTGENRGTQVNTVAGEKVYFNSMEGIEKGVAIFCNRDNDFRPTAQSVTRTLSVSISVRPCEEKLVFRAYDTLYSPPVEAELEVPNVYEAARNPLSALDAMSAALSKSGGTIFEIENVDIDLQSDQIPFVRSSELNAFRRELLTRYHAARIAAYRRTEAAKPVTDNRLYTGEKLDYHANISNSLSRRFYENLGFQINEIALECGAQQTTTHEVMRTPYCVRREVGCCLMDRQFGGQAILPQLRISKHEELFLENNGRRLALVFHCATCEMGVLFA